MDTRSAVQWAMQQKCVKGCTQQQREHGQGYFRCPSSEWCMLGVESEGLRFQDLLKLEHNFGDPHCEANHPVIIPPVRNACPHHELRTLALQTEDPYGSFHKQGAPCRPQYTMIGMIGTPKKVVLTLGNPQIP